MKAFYSPVAEGNSSPVTGIVARPVEPSPSPEPNAPIHVRVRARVAVYDDPSAAPRVVDVEPGPVAEFIESLSATVHELARGEGGTIPYTVIREVAENFIHANFSEPVVSVLDGGQTIRFADQGPGMRDKDRVLLPGFTTARGEMKQFIRGVGSGLPLVREYLVHSGGSLAIEDNLGAGSVVTVYSGLRGMRRPVVTHPSERRASASFASSRAMSDQTSLYPAEPSSPEPRLSARQKHVLALVLESGLAGPSLISKELGVGVSTAYRDLASLEEAGLISAADAGKRTLTDEGLAYLGRLSKNS